MLNVVKTENITVDPNKTLVDDFAELYNRIAQDVERLEKMKKQLSKLANADETQGPITLHGYRHSIDYSAFTESLELAVTPQTFARKTKAWDCMTVSVTAARKKLSDEQIAAFFAVKQGSRRFRRVK